MAKPIQKSKKLWSRKAGKLW